MIDHRDRPFAPPQPAAAPSSGVMISSRSRRFAGRLVDIALAVGSMSVGAGLSVVVFGAAEPGAVLAWLTVLVLQACLIAMRAQTFGKVVMRTMMIDRHGHPVGLGRGFLMRELLLLTLKSWSVALVLVDAAFLFRSDHRCLHDHFAGTRVVDCER